VPEEPDNGGHTELDTEVGGCLARWAHAHRASPRERISLLQRQADLAANDRLSVGWGGAVPRALC
jgi:hypothetical protein